MAAASISPAGTNQAPSNTWYAYKTSSGDYGLAQLGNVPKDVVQSIDVGTADTVGDLASKGAGAFYPAFKQLGITTDLWTQLVAQLDAGAGTSNPSFIQVGVTGPKSNKSTKISGDATAGGISIPGVSLSSITGVLGSLSFWKGIGLVLAGVGLLIFAGLEIRKVAG